MKLTLRKKPTITKDRLPLVLKFEWRIDKVKPKRSWQLLKKTKTARPKIPTWVK